MSAPTPFSARRAPVTPARAMRSRMHRRSSLQPTGPAQMRVSISPVKPRVLFSHRSRSSLGHSVSGGALTPSRATAGGVTTRRSRGRASAAVSLATSLFSSLETLDDEEEQPWWEEIEDVENCNAETVQRLIDTLKEQRETHSQERRRVKEVILAKEEQHKAEISDMERMHSVQLRQEEHRHEEALDVAEDEFSQQERILLATLKENERLMIQVGLLQTHVEDCEYALAEAYGPEDWETHLSQAATERAGKTQPQSHMDRSTRESTLRSIQALSHAAQESLPPISSVQPRSTSPLRNSFSVNQGGTHGHGASVPNEDEEEGDESEVSMLLQSHSGIDTPDASAGQLTQQQGRSQAYGPTLPKLVLPQSTPKPRRISNISAATAVTAPLPWSSPAGPDVTFETAGGLNPDSSAAGEYLRPATPLSSGQGSAWIAVRDMRVALKGIQRDLALDLYARQEYLDKAAKERQSLQQLVDEIAASHGITLPSIRT